MRIVVVVVVAAVAVPGPKMSDAVGVAADVAAADAQRELCLHSLCSSTQRQCIHKQSTSHILMQCASGRERVTVLVCVGSPIELFGRVNILCA